jgi:hypothetical protein
MHIIYICRRLGRVTHVTPHTWDDNRLGESWTCFEVIAPCLRDFVVNVSEEYVASIFRVEVTGMTVAVLYLFTHSSTSLQGRSRRI